MKSSTVDTEEARDLLHNLVSIPSLSGEEHACAEALSSFFDDHGREVWIDDIGNVRAPAEDDILLTSHIDTVSGDLPVRIEDDVLWGRGSVDAKGSLAAMAIGAVRAGVSFIGVVGEEEDSRGARYLLETRSAPKALVNGEPSGWDSVTFGYRGSIHGKYTTTSERGHSSRPENNALQDAMRSWIRVEDQFTADEEKRVTEQVTAKPIAIEGGRSSDGLAIETMMDISLRVPIDSSVDEVCERAEQYLTRGSIDWTYVVEPTFQSQRTTLASTIRAAIRQVGGDPRPLVKTGTSDMNFYAAEWDCPMVTYGPGDSDLDHTPDERLSLTEFDRAVDIFERTACRLKERL